MTNEDIERLEQLVETLAGADGCEGGEFLEGLLDLARRAWGGGYSYAHSSKLVEERLWACLRDEIEAHKEMIFGPDPGQYGYENVDLLRESIRRLEGEIIAADLKATRGTRDMLE